MIVKSLGTQPYTEVWNAMREWVESDSPSQIWQVEHFPVYTQGQAGKAEHLLAPGDIEVVQTDRGGQVTYHGPGQQILYPLLVLKDLGLNVRQVISAMEDSVIDLLAEQGVEAEARKDAPGVYVNDAKISSLGLRVRKGRTFHGIALNVDMDLSPFDGINPCGYAGLSMTDMARLGLDTVGVVDRWTTLLINRLGQ